MEEQSESYLNGWHAHRAGVDVDENPHNERTEPLSNMRWCSGWCARFSAVKHGQSLELDEVTS